jgi:hypothetical protein
MNDSIIYYLIIAPKSLRLPVGALGFFMLLSFLLTLSQLIAIGGRWRLFHPFIINHQLCPVFRKFAHLQ